ncbi:MAG: hypothetical protein LBT59_18520 [Clostridiales bacterium]|jgi:hypothetical protein|nr:hypothetical protein [Clostridiales bacterium]
MGNPVDSGLEGVLQETITKYLDQDFMLKSYSYNDEYRHYYVKGSIFRHDQYINIQVSVSRDGYKPNYWHIIDREFNKRWRSLGSITVGMSSELVVADPGYSFADSRPPFTLGGLRTGTWDLRLAIDATPLGERCEAIELYHQSATNEKGFQWDNQAMIPVDSGALCFVDPDYYYTHVGKCNVLGLNFAGIFFCDSKYIGMVSRAGIYDGEYPLYSAKLKGHIVAAKISFAQDQPRRLQRPEGTELATADIVNQKRLWRHRNITSIFQKS